MEESKYYYVEDNEWEECERGYSCSNMHDMTSCPKYTISNMSISKECIIDGPHLVETPHCPYGSKLLESKCEACYDDTKYCPHPSIGEISCPSILPNCSSRRNRIYPSISQNYLTSPTQLQNIFVVVPYKTTTSIIFLTLQDLKYNNALLLCNSYANIWCYNSPCWCHDHYCPWYHCPENYDCSFSKRTFSQQTVNIEEDLCPGYTQSTVHYHDNHLGPVWRRDDKWPETCIEHPGIKFTLPFGYNLSTSTYYPQPSYSRFINYEYIPYLRNQTCMAGTYRSMGFTYCRTDLGGHHTYRGVNNNMSLGDKTYCLNGYFCTRLLLYENSVSASFPEHCPAGTYMRSESIFQGVVYEWQNCMECPSGYYCPGNNQVILCPPGSVCRHGSPSATESSCPQGSFMSSDSGEIPQRIRRVLFEEDGESSSLEGQVSANSCIACEAGSYCLEGIAEDICPVGYWCPSFTSDPHQYPIPRGKYYTYDEMEPIPATSPSDGVDCPEGHYCPVASHQSYPCPPGTYQPNYTPSLSSNLQCLLCPIGKYCSENLENKIVQSECRKNMYCPIARNAPLYPPPGTAPTSENFHTSVHGFAFYMGAQNACGERHQCTMGTIHPNQV